MSTTITQLETAWSDVWESETLLGITSRIHTYAITQDSEKEISLLYNDKQINYVEAISTRHVIHQMTGKKEYVYTVTVNYTRQKDQYGASWKAVRNFFDTLYTEVTTTLSHTWGGTVDLWEPQDGPPEISEQTIDNKAVWRGTFTFRGFKVA